MNENEFAKLNEEELDQVAGGVLDTVESDFDCWFTITNPQQHDFRADGTVWIKCGSSVCMTLVNKCHCWRRGQCSNKWHRIHWNDLFPNMLWPENDTNHWKKIPSKQYNT